MRAGQSLSSGHLLDTHLCLSASSLPFQVGAELTMRKKKKRGMGPWSRAVPQTPTRCTLLPKDAAPRTVSCPPCPAVPAAPRPRLSPCPRPPAGSGWGPSLRYLQHWLPQALWARPRSQPLSRCWDATGGFRSRRSFFYISFFLNEHISPPLRCLARHCLVGIDFHIYQYFTVEKADMRHLRSPVNSAT